MEFAYLVLGFALGVGVGLYFGLRRAPSSALMIAVNELHVSLFAPFGFNVAFLFNNVWKAAGLEENGIIDITDGKT